MKKLIILLLVATVSLSAVPRAIVFDFTGVMAGNPNYEAVSQFLCESFRFTQTEFKKANLRKQQATKSGKTEEEFWLGLANEQGIILPHHWPHQLRSVIKNAIRVDSEMYLLVDQLREKQIPIALLSNINEKLSKLVRECQLYDPFNPCLLSHEIGVAKPDPKAYQILLKRLNLPAKDIVFIDDKSENVNVAKKLGLDAIVFRSADQIRQELKKRGL